MANNDEKPMGISSSVKVKYKIGSGPDKKRRRSSPHNPLILNDTLGKIMTFIPTDILKDFRQVSKLWNQEASRVLAVRCTITFKNAKSLEDFNSEVLSTSSSARNNARRLFRKFNFTSTPPGVVVYNNQDQAHIYGDNPISLFSLHAQYFFNICGSSMTSLTLDIKSGFPIVLRLSDLQDILFNFCPNLRKLELLHIPADVRLTEQFLDYRVCCLCLGKKYYNNGPIKLKITDLKIPIYANNSYKFIEDLLTSCPELETLSVLTVRRLEPPTGLFENIQTLRTSGHLRDLNSFILEGENGDTVYLGDETALAFSNIDIQWKHLTLKVLNPAILVIILKAHGCQLKSLDVTNICSEDWVSFNADEIPIMEDLTSLTVVSNRLPISKFLLRSPNLTKCSLTVDFRGLNWVGIDAQNFNDVQLKQMRELDLKSCPFSKKDCKIFSKIFPNLKAIEATEMRINSEFYNICKYLGSRLEELTIIDNGTLEDEEFVGNQCDPGIQSLSKLKRLKIQGPRRISYRNKNRDPYCNLTRNIFIDGILKLKQLSSLTVNIEQIDDKTLDKIRGSTFSYLRRLEIVDNEIKPGTFQSLKTRLPYAEIIRIHPYFEYTRKGVQIEERKRIY